MKGENLDEELEHTGDEFLAKPKWQRFLVLVAGPMMNIFTAIAIPAGMAMLFFQVPAYHSQPAIVNSVAQSSAAIAAGIKPGDRIIRIDNKENPTWYDVEIKGQINPNIATNLVIERNGEQIQTTLTPKVHYAAKQQIGLTGLLPNYKQEPVIVGEVSSGLPAAKAGLKSDDKIVMLNGEEVKHFYWLTSSLQNLEGQEIQLKVARQNEMLDLKIVPQRSPEGKIILGFMPKKGTVTTPDYITERKPLIAAVKYSVEKNYEFVVLTKEALGQIFSGKRSVKEGLSGPIGIAELSGRAYESGGIEGLLNLMGLLSLNLGVFNLFPIPVLDGGHIFMLLLEALLGLIGYKLSVALKEKMLQAGFVLLILLMSFVVINDISKFFVPRETTPVAPTTSTPNK